MESNGYQILINRIDIAIQTIQRKTKDNALAEAFWTGQRLAHKRDKQWILLRWASPCIGPDDVIVHCFDDNPDDDTCLICGMPRELAGEIDGSETEPERTHLKWLRSQGG